MAARRPYERSNAGWWRRNPVFIGYLAREATCVAVAAYALILVVGLLCLARGEDAFGAWLAALRSPASILLHVVLFAGFAFHTWSWFVIMPKTMPPLVIAGHRMAAGTITAAGIAAAIACSAVLLTVVATLAR